MTEPFTGGCTCGGVRYECTDPSPAVYACHCTACQHRTSSAFGVSVRTTADHFKLVKGKPRQISRTAESGNTVITNFCPDCGNSVFGQGANPALRVIYGGTLDDPKRFSLQANIWTRSALPWAHIHPDLPSFEQMPPMPGQQKSSSA